MRKITLVFFLVALLSVSAFADHPSGWGVGVVGQGSFGLSGAGRGGAALSLKMPHLPIYWGIDFGLSKNYLGIGATGDLYFIDDTLARDINLGWFFGLGAYADVYLYNGSESGISLGVGARTPIGVNIFPLNFLEIFLDLAPSLGVGFGIGDRGGIGLDSGIGADFGVRFWF